MGWLSRLSRLKRRLLVRDPKPILVYTRFSIILPPGKQDGFAAGRTEDRDAYIAAIMDERRLRIRESIFFDYTLPNIELAVRDNPLIRHLVVSSTLLPEWMRRRLENAAEEYPWLRLVYLEPDQSPPWERLFRLHLAQLDLPTHCAAVARLDDDDVLSPGFFASLKSYICPTFIDFCISHGKGFQAYWNEGFKRFAPCWSPMISAGMAMIVRFDANKQAIVSRYPGIPGNHKNVGKICRTVVDPNASAFIKTWHRLNDLHVGRQVTDDEICKKIGDLETDRTELAGLFKGAFV